MGVEILGEKVVLFRDAQGAIQCLHDVCPHRGAPLHRVRLPRPNWQQSCLRDHATVFILLLQPSKEQCRSFPVYILWAQMFGLTAWLVLHDARGRDSQSSLLRCRGGWRRWRGTTAWCAPTTAGRSMARAFCRTCRLRSTRRSGRASSSCSPTLSRKRCALSGPPIPCKSSPELASCQPCQGNVSVGSPRHKAIWL